MSEILPTITFLIGFWIGYKLSKSEQAPSKPEPRMPEFKLPAYSPTQDKFRVIDGKDFTYFKDSQDKKRLIH